MFAILMGLKSVSPEHLQQLLQERQVTVIDVNSRQSWVKGHVPGAMSLDPATYSDADLPADKEAGLVFIAPIRCAERHPTRRGERRRWATAMPR